MPKKKSSRKRKVIHQKIEKTTGFKVCSQNGTLSETMRKMGIINLPVSMPVDGRGVTGTRAATEKELKKVEAIIREHSTMSPWNYPKGANIKTGLYIKEIVRKTSYAHKMF